MRCLHQDHNTDKLWAENMHKVDTLEEKDGNKVTACILLPARPVGKQRHSEKET